MSRPNPIVLGVLAAHASVSAAAGSALPEASGLSSALQVVLGLAAVMGAIAVAAWLMRKYAPGMRGAGGLVRVVGGVMVGPRERVVVVEVAGTWLVLGVTGTQVNALHALPRPEGPDGQAAAGAAEPPAGGFEARLARVLRGRQP
jgi:flagellar protein FliO/FliZ